MNGLHNHHPRRPLTGVGLLICLAGLLSIVFSITLRVIPNALPATVLAALNTSAQDLNNLNIIFQYSLIMSLVLAGLFVDMVGPRTVLVVSVAIAVICDYLFGHSHSVRVLMNSRILIGYTHPLILTSALVLGTHWLPRRHFSLFVGMLFGTMLMAPVLVFPAITILSTREALQKFIFLVNSLGIIIIFAIILTERIADKTSHRHDIAGLFKPLTYYKVWLICIVSMLGWMSNTFLLHYGPFYLVSHFGFDPHGASDTIDTSFSCFGIGAIFMGMISDMFSKKRRYLIAGGYLLAALCFSIMVFGHNVSEGSVANLIFLTAFFTSSTIICYSKASDYCAIGNSGITLGLVLSITAIGSSLFAKISGTLLKHYVDDPINANPETWNHIVVIVPLLLVFGAVIAATVLKPTHLKPITPSPTPDADSVKEKKNEAVH